MSATPVQIHLSNAPRPTGMIEPKHERARRALIALRAGRLRDVREHIDALPVRTSMDCGWKFLLASLLAAEQGDLTAAKMLLLDAATALAPSDLEDPKEVEETDSQEKRLAALVHEKLGWVHRHQDRPDEARDFHMRAFQMRKQHGSLEELWETACSLGLDADLAGHDGDAQAWHLFALGIAKQVAEEPDKKQAVAWANLSRSFQRAGMQNRAVEAARNSRDKWLAHDPGHINTPRAELHLGHTILKLAEGLMDRDPKRTAGLLDEAILSFDSALEALLAFGPQAAADSRWSADQGDFARRLRETLGLPPQGAQ